MQNLQKQTIQRRQSTPAAQQQIFSCQIYSSPVANQIIQAYEPAVLRWDPSCLSSEKTIDIYLQSVDAAIPIHVWKSVITSAAQLSTSFVPDWWNSTSDVALQLVITGIDQPAWAGHGPSQVFYAHFNGTIPHDYANSHSGGVQSGGISVEVINDLRHRSHGLSSAKLGAAIFFPILAVAVSIAAYVFISRRRSGQASKRWSQFVDQRMSMIGASDWELAPPPSLRSVPRGRAESIVRHSASLPPRPSFGSHTNPRFSAYSLDPRMSAADPRMSSYSANPRMSAVNPRMSTLSFNPPPSIAAAQMAQHRQSKVSFVEPSGSPESRSHKSSLNISISRPTPPSLTSDLIMSPTQQKGPDVLNGNIRVMTTSFHSLDSANRQSKVFRPGHQPTSSIARSASNLRFEFEGNPDAGAPKMVMNGSKPTSTHEPTGSDLSSSTNSSAAKFQSTLSTNQVSRSTVKTEVSSLGSGNASGMRRLAVRTSVLSPDEALRQYTLSRERSDDNTTSTSPNDLENDTVKAEVSK